MFALQTPNKTAVRASRAAPATRMPARVVCSAQKQDSSIDLRKAGAAVLASAAMALTTLTPRYAWWSLFPPLTISCMRVCLLS